MKCYIVKGFENKPRVPQRVTDDQRYYCIGVACISPGKAKQMVRDQGQGHTNNFIHKRDGKRKNNNHGQNQIIE